MSGVGVFRLSSGVTKGIGIGVVSGGDSVEG